MSRIIALVILAACAVAPRLASAVTIPTVLVGNVGNSPDQLWISGNPTNLQFGSVAYDYRIGTTEVTNAQYAEFLNAKAASDPLALYNTGMGSDPRGGITRSGAGTIPNPYVYTAKTDMGNKPVNFVSWYDSIRFANWLNNGQGAGDTETGAYTLLGGSPTPSNGLSITRNVGATWFLASEDEWYKSAYYQPFSAGGDVDNYWLYPTGSNSTPTIATANSVGDVSNPGWNVVNYDSGADWNSQNGNLTTVGSAGPLSDSYYGTSYSFYGTADQGGNVWEWNEALIGGTWRGKRGGAFNSIAYNLRSSERALFNLPTNEAHTFGFRVAALATVPEPSTIALAAFSLASLIVCAWRERRI